MKTTTEINGLAAIYDRGSTLRQKDNYSRGDARREGIMIADRNGFKWEYHKEIKSGANLARREVLLKILDRIASGQIQAIIVQDLDRLARPDEQADFETIKNICIRADVKIFTQSGIYDFLDSDDVMMGRVKMAFAGRERDYITQRSIRGKKEKALGGGFMGGLPALGYKVCYKLTETGKRISWLEIEASERPTAEKLFELYILHGAYGCSKRLNELGYRGKTGSEFIHSTVLDVIKNPIYAGYVTWARTRRESKWLRNYEPESVHKPELQIVSLETWEKAQEVHKKRSHDYKSDGSWGTSPFTGYLACEDCGLGMVLKSAKQVNGKKTKFYQCNGRALAGPQHCNGKTHTLDLVARGVIPFMVELLTRDLDLNALLQDAVDRYGYTITESELRQQLEAELHATKERQARLVQSITEGIITQTEAKTTAQDLRDKIARIERELKNLGSKVRVREDYLQAMEILKGRDIEQFLWAVLEYETAIFRQFLGLIFEPNSITVETYRIKGREFGCRVTDYRFTEEFGNLQSSDDVLTLRQKYRLLIDLSELMSSKRQTRAMAEVG
jgi:DNA invertase Pin-like site-specific DNA recombinase